MMPTLHIRLLGDFSLMYGDDPVTGIKTPRLRSLLAYLALHHDTPQLRQHLAFLFWPDTSEAQARTNLRQLLHELRHALPDADRFLEADASTVRWRAEASLDVDAVEFERALDRADAAGQPEEQRAALERAARLYHADLLPRFVDEWILPVREQLRQRHHRALGKLIDGLEARRDYAQAIVYAQRLFRDDPLDEESCRDLMRLLALNNERAAALRVYQRCVDALQRELGVEPAETTRQAYERLLGSGEPAAPAAEGAPRRDPGAPMIGRQREWERLQSAWRSTDAGEPGFVLITGEAGIGKSRLAEELLRWAQAQGVGVARTRSYAAEGQLSLAPVTDWLRSEALRPQLARLDRLWLTEVSRIMPELLASEPELPALTPIAEYGQRQRFFEALARAVLAAPQPLILLIDDLQWCDQETLAWLHYLLRFDQHARLLVVGTARDEELPPAHPLRATLLHLHNAIQVTELSLERLDAAETARLAAHITSRELDAEGALQLYRETEGNPLFVVEMMRAGFAGAERRELGGDWSGAQWHSPTVPPSGLPPKVQAVIEARLAQVSAPARALAELAAAVGRAFTLDLLIQAGHTDEDSAVRALDELWQKRIVRENAADSYDFAHDKLREVTYAQIAAPQRRLLHRRIVQALQARYAGDLDPVIGQIASQYERAGLAQEAILSYQRAAVVAQRLYANEDAIQLLLHALGLLGQQPPGVRRDAQELTLQLALAPLYRMTKGWTSPETEHVLERAMALCDTVGDDAQRLQVFYGMQSLYVVQARLEKVQLVTDDLHRLSQRMSDRPPPLETEMMLAGTLLHLGRVAEANSGFEQMIATHDPTQLQRIVEEQGWNYAIHARAWQAHAVWLLGYPEGAIRRATEAVRIAQDLAQPFNQALALTYLAMLQQLCADPASAQTAAEAALAFTTEYRAPYYHAWAAILVSYGRASRQPGPQAGADLRGAIDVLAASGAKLRLPYFLGLLASVHHQAGQIAEGLAAIDEGMAASRIHNERWWDAELHRLRGTLLLSGGADAPEAEAAYLRAIEIAQAQQARLLELRATLSLAELWRARHRAEDARRVLSERYGWFSEGFDTPDLRAARALLSAI